MKFDIPTNNIVIYCEDNFLKLSECVIFFIKSIENFRSDTIFSENSFFYEQIELSTEAQISLVF